VGVSVGVFVGDGVGVFVNVGVRVFVRVGVGVFVVVSVTVAVRVDVSTDPNNCPGPHDANSNPNKINLTANLFIDLPPQ